MTLNIVSFSGFNPTDEVRVDVWCDQPSVNSIGAVTGTGARHAAGDTMVTFTEHAPFLANPDATAGDYKAALANTDSPDAVRYRIYRSTSPISATSIRTAELVDEIRPMSNWSLFYYNGTENDASPCIRLPVDNEVLAEADQGIYVRRAQGAATAYYAVSKAVNGEEELSSWSVGGNATGAVSESSGTGMVLLRTRQTNVSFQYVNNADLYYYVRWECPPYYNRPSTAWDYLVGVPPTSVDPRPVDIALHCWGGTLNSGYGWWYEAEQGALIVATNMSPYDWWTAFHDNYGTIKPFTEVDGSGGGRVRNYAAKRILSFLNDFVKAEHNVDDDRVFVTGSSMGGSGCLMWGARTPEVFAYTNGWVGVYIPRESPTFKGSFEGVYGQDAWNCEYEDTGMSAFDYWDTEQYILADPGRDMPFICTANGKNDSGIGWTQAWKTITALQAARQPHKFVWGQSGHSQRSILPGENQSDRYVGVRISKNQTVPAFTNCSQDGDMGDGDPDVGDTAGHINRYLLWDVDDVVDEAGRWEMTVYLIAASPDTSCTVDVTPRRCRNFSPGAGTACDWENRDATTGTVIESGVVVSGQYGLVTLPQITVNRRNVNKNRLVITYTVAPAAPVITSPLHATGTVGQAFSYTITATGSPPITYDASDLPSWAAFDAGTHTIGGVPDAAGVTDATISAENAYGTDSKTLVMEILSGGDVIPPAIGISHIVLAGEVSDDLACPAQVVINGTPVAVDVTGLSGMWASGDIVLLSGNNTFVIVASDGTNETTTEVSVGGIP